MHNGFSAAAQAPGVGQPAVTQHIKALEDPARASSAAAAGASSSRRRAAICCLWCIGR
jgi:hypothetical protein